MTIGTYDVIQDDCTRLGIECIEDGTPGLAGIGAPRDQVLPVPSSVDGQVRR
ncbi:hypothetical protein ACWCQN_42835 [Streptomyces sp. NPDC001984]